MTSLVTVGAIVGSMACGGTTATDLVEEYVAGSSGLINQGNGYYQFNWKTPTTYANTCRTFALNLEDGATTFLQANFRFRK